MNTPDFRKYGKGFYDHFCYLFENLQGVNKEWLKSTMVNKIDRLMEDAYRLGYEAAQTNSWKDKKER